MRRGQRQRHRRKTQLGSTAAIAVAIPCHDANILLRDRLAPAGGSRRKFHLDFGTGVAEVRRHCARLETRMLLRLLRRRYRPAWTRGANARTTIECDCAIREPSTRGS